MGKVVYVVSKYSRADRSYARHWCNDEGLPLCGAKSSHTYEYEESICDCRNCLRLRPIVEYSEPEFVLVSGKYCRNCHSTEWHVSPDPDIRCCNNCSETWQRGDDGKWIYDSEIDEPVQSETVLSVADLIRQSVGKLDSERVRAAKRWQICYVGDYQHGEYATPPNASNTVWIKQGDPLPENCKRYADSEVALRTWFDAKTVKTGPNVWRWNLGQIERILLGQ